MLEAISLHSFVFHFSNYNSLSNHLTLTPKPSYQLMTSYLLYLLYLSTIYVSNSSSL